MGFTPETNFFFFALKLEQTFFSVQGPGFEVKSGGDIACTDWQDPKGRIFLERPLIRLHAKMVKRGGDKSYYVPPTSNCGGTCPPRPP